MMAPFSLRTPLRASERRELDSIATETEAGLRAEALLNFATHQEQAGRVELAAEVYALVGAERPGEAGALAHRARVRLDAILGRGATGARAEFLLRNFAQQAADPAAIFALGAAGAVFRLTRLATLSRLAASAQPSLWTGLIGAGRLASLAGFAAEAPAFALASRLGNAALGREQEWSGRAIGREMASSYLVLGGLRLAGWASGAAYETLGAGSVRSIAGTVPTLFQQAGMLGGILLGHRAEEWAGLREPRAGATTMLDSLALLLQFHVAGRLTGHAWGESFPAWERGLQLQAEALAGTARHGSNIPAVALAVPGRRTASDLLQGPLLMAMSGDRGSEPPESGPRLSVAPELRDSSVVPVPGGLASPDAERLTPIPESGPPTIPTDPPDQPVGTASFHELLRSEGRDLERPQVSLEPVERTFGETTVAVNARAGYESVQRALGRMQPWTAELRQTLAARPDQPWFIAGVSDGMGFHSAVALMEAGVRHMVGGFYEPEALIKMESPVHLGRLANVEGLRIFARERGVDFQVFYEDLVLPQHGKITRAFPETVRQAIGEARRRAGNPDLNFVNSIAFARWISPSPEVPQLKGIPSLDLQGRVVLMDMKPYQAKGYEGTLDSMGRNHQALLEALGANFGPRSTSFFFTWAGGSQNRRILHGVYGGGALGHAKEIGETAAVRYHLESQAAGYARGYHKVVRFPDFPSFALFGIPGGGAFGMLARHVLESHGRYADMGELAPRAYLEAFGEEHNLANPLAQIELDVPESYHLPEIRRNLQTFYDRVAAYRQAHPEWTGKEPLDAATSRELLRGLVSEAYVAQIPQATE